MNALLLKLLPWLLLGSIATNGITWWSGHHTGYASGAASVQIKLDKLNVQIAQEREAASEASRSAEQKHAAALAAASATYQEDLTHAKAASDRLVADLRAGNVKLRDQWSSCIASSVVPSPAGSAGAADGITQFRAAIEGAVFEDIADQIRDSAKADATIRALQAVVRADREATKPKQ